MLLVIPGILNAAQLDKIHESLAEARTGEQANCSRCRATTGINFLKGRPACTQHSIILRLSQLNWGASSHSRAWTTGKSVSAW